MYSVPASVRIGLVVADVSFEEVVQLAREMPVWVPEFLVNSNAAAFLRALTPFVVTTFHVKRSDDPNVITTSILADLDEHHNEVSQNPPYSAIRILGAMPEEISWDSFEEFGFHRIERDKRGFTVFK